MTESMPTTFSHSLASLVETGDTPQTLAVLVSDCAALYPAGGVAVMVDSDRGLTPLSATSQTELELELLQLQVADGPCIEALRTQQLVWGAGEAMVERWPELGRAVLAAGHQGVHAYPMRWRGQPVGGLNVFVDDTAEPASERRALGQLYADLASLVLADPGVFTADELSARVHSAVQVRATVERAKGVIAFEERVDIATAHDRLAARAREDRVPLGEMAARVVERAATRPPT